MGGTGSGTGSGRVVLVTGGASGIGLAAAVAFGRLGDTVVIAGRRQARGDTAVETVNAAGGTARFIPTDLTDPEQIAALHTAILRDHGRLDVAFDNAGFQEPRRPVVEQDAALYDRVTAAAVTSLATGRVKRLRSPVRATPCWTFR